MIDLPIGKPRRKEISLTEVLEALRSVESVCKTHLTTKTYRKKGLTLEGEKYFEVCLFIAQVSLVDVKRGRDPSKVLLFPFLKKKRKSTVVIDVFKLNDIETITDLLGADTGVISRIRRDFTKLHLRMPVVVDALLSA